MILNDNHRTLLVAVGAGMPLTKTAVFESWHLQGYPVSFDNDVAFQDLSVEGYIEQSSKNRWQLSAKGRKAIGK